jgi:hypothetical protein
MFQPKFDAEKFRGLILYAADQARAKRDQYFGAVKLNKILFYSDFIMFQRYGVPITGATYQKLREGPAPKELLVQRRILIGEGDADLKPTQVFNYVQRRLIPTAKTIDPTNWFKSEEIVVIDEVIKELKGMTAAQVSGLSHREGGWMMAKEGEPIPYEAALLEPDYGDGSSELQMSRDDGF